MSGHSKWNNIKNKKGAADAKRSAVFTQIAKNIRIAVKDGGSGDPKFNSGLRLQVEKARQANMPKDKIQKAIDAGLGKSADGKIIQEIRYEGFFPFGVATIIVAFTDNPNRTSAELKNLLNKNGGSMGAPGSANYMFRFDKENQEYVCDMPIELDETQKEKIENLKEKIEELKDVENIYLAC